MHFPSIAFAGCIARIRQAWWITLGLLLVGLMLPGLADPGFPRFDKFKKFDSIYEPSGIQQLPDGRFVVVEDEASHPLGLVRLETDGELREYPLYRASWLSWASPNRVLGMLEDLEAVASDSRGQVFAITSHSRKENGKRADPREQLARFSLEDDRVVDFEVVRGLRKKIAGQHPLLKEATRIRDVKDDGGFNIEGLSFDADKQRLLLGLRAPLHRSNAIIVVLNNPHAVFDQGQEPVIGERLIQLDLDGGGIRALAYDPHLEGYLIVSRKPGKSFKLWLWSGDPDASPQRLRVPDLKNLRQTEGVTPVRLDGKPVGILLVSDEGSGIKNDPGRYAFLRYDQLERR